MQLEKSSDGNILERRNLGRGRKVNGRNLVSLYYLLKRYISSSPVILDLAWAVSLCSDGKTYASTGGSGAVTLHSVEPSFSYNGDGGDAFGVRLAHIPTGRSKFGFYLDYSPVDSTKIAMSNENGQVSNLHGTSIMFLINYIPYR
jgi:hypothetical protein